MNLEIHRSETGKNVFLDLIGDLDMAGAPVLRQSVVQEVSKGNNFLVLDLSGLTLLVGLNDELQKVFELCELDQIFNMKLRRELN